MNFFDLSNLLDQDGNLQNEMMLFAFAATLLSTIPVLLGNEFDINVGLKRRKRSSYDQRQITIPKLHKINLDSTNLNLFNLQDHSIKDSWDVKPTWDDIKFKNSPSVITDNLNHNPNQYSFRTEGLAPIQDQDKTIVSHLKDVMRWSKYELKRGGGLVTSLTTLLMNKIHGIETPTDKLVKAIHKLSFDINRKIGFY